MFFTFEELMSGLQVYIKYTYTSRFFKDTKETVAYIYITSLLLILLVTFAYFFVISVLGAQWDYTVFSIYVCFRCFLQKKTFVFFFLCDSNAKTS
jgi:hypothetical protein